MPNHVHALVSVTKVPMAQFVKNWKGYTARQCNQILEQRKGSFWSDDYFDNYIRDAEHERRTIQYIESNPVKARFVLQPAEWPWSSARFRDQNGVLRIPPLIPALPPGNGARL